MKRNRLIVAYLGPEKTNTHLAALKKFGRRAQCVHQPTVDEVFHQVERERADYGVVPIENSLGGAVTHTLDRFIDFRYTPVRILGEIDLPIRHHLILHPRAKLEKIRAVYSHPQAFQQCEAWLRSHLPAADRSETDSTAEAVRRLLFDRVGRWSTVWKKSERAAVGRKDLAESGGLRAVPIPQERENRTRFLVLGLPKAAPALRGKAGRRFKTSLLLGIKDEPGALHEALGVFRRAGINLTKIESRPSKRKAWEYLFFIDFEGRESDPRIKRLLQRLTRSSSLLRVLGSYPVSAQRPGGR